jgi:signal transduction histidine kinase
VSRARVTVPFVLSAAALLGVMAWLTSEVRRLEAARMRGLEEAAVEEGVRLSLWRMESLLAPFVAQENSRPHHLYRAFYPARLASARTSAPPAPAGLHVSSPLAATGSPHVRLYFQWDENGRLTTPRLPPETWRSRDAGARRTYEEAQGRLDALGRLLDGHALSARLDDAWLTIEPPVRSADTRTAAATLPTPTPVPPVTRAAEAPPAAGTQQSLLNTQEFQARLQVFEFSQTSQIADVQGYRPPAPFQTAEVRVGLLQPVWLADELVMARRVRVDRSELLQGAWLDWPEVRAWLLGSVRDLFPDATLVPVRDGEPDQGRRLAALPVRFQPGRLAVAAPPSRSPLGLPLVVAWAFAAVAVLAVGGLLWGMATLDERRSAFVSAVTHELRTPLTTFRLYADMLADGMVEDEEQRRTYITTLQREAERQSHLVENVLAYSRLERGRPARRAVVGVGELLAAILPPLEALAGRASTRLVVAADDACRDTRVAVDPAAVERILFNLVDNACKHARGAADPTLLLEGRIEGGVVRLTLADRGAGIAPRLRRRLFRPFHKSAEDAAGAVPGVGLGLALSRRLARAQGGDLRLADSSAAGSRFSLTLPVAAGQRQK